MLMLKKKCNVTRKLLLIWMLETHDGTRTEIMSYFFRLFATKFEFNHSSLFIDCVNFLDSKTAATFERPF